MALLAASRYRERHSVAWAKFDHADAVMLANIARTARCRARRRPADTDLAQAISVLTRAGQDTAWNRQQIANQLRSVLREYFPAALEAFREVKYGLASVEALIILAATPTPARARTLAEGQLRDLLVTAGRQRGIDEWVDPLHHLFSTEQLRRLPGAEPAFIGEQARSRHHAARCGRPGG
ncbi:transposase [Rhodococcus sp. T2V]|uniref:IS110 family transposase n=1 Tax=Rhodococcus sp. T2V TaxID=3034164 RepID=UPI0023E0CC9B|nr:transposase [Rhodococcus sp. T2V]MDF3309639.1 transposase [Rhodococcus sp. T2V]